MTHLLTLLLYALATARMVRLIIKDEVLRAPRKWWLDHAPKGTLRRYWITCEWCVSAAAALWPAAAYVLAPDHPVPRIAAAVLAFSWLAVLAGEGMLLLEGKAKLYNQPMPEPESAGAEQEGR